MNRSLHLRRFRAAALFIIVMNLIALVIGVVMFLTGASAGDVEFDASVVITATILVLVPAFMAWNGSIIGAVLLLTLLTAELVLSFDTAALMQWETLRGVVYVFLGAWILGELIRYRLRSREVSEAIGGSAIIRWGGKGLVAFGAAAMAVMSYGYQVPSAPTGILTARQISGEQYRWMVNNNILGVAERVFYFSDDAGKPYTESGNLLTDQFIGAWWQEEGELETGWIRIGEICRVETTRTASDVAENMYTIHTFGEDSWLRILLPKADAKSRAFVARMKYLNSEKMHSEVRSACDENREPDWDLVAAANGIPSEVVGPEKISRRQLSWLRHHDFLPRGAKVLNFYSHGHYSIAEGGLLLTDQRFGGWSKDTDGLHSWWFDIGQICSITKKKDASEARGPLYRVENEKNWFEFHLPDVDGQDRALINTVREMNIAVQSDETAEACTAFLSEKPGEQDGAD